MTFRLSNRSKQRREGVDPRLIEISDLAIIITTVDFGIPEHGGVRDQDEQYELFCRGVSRANGYDKKSKHQPAGDGLGKALDFFAYVNGRADWTPEHLAMVAAAFLQAASLLGYKLKWGGLWRFKDMPHVELAE